MKPNPKNYEGWVDPTGGQWIRVKGASKYEGVIWRPQNIQLGDEEDADGNLPLSFDIEYMVGEGFVEQPEHEDPKWQEITSTIIMDIVMESARVANESSNSNPS